MFYLQYFHLSSFRSKLGIGLLSGKYSKPPPEVSEGKQNNDELQPGISPHMFKSLIGKGHPLFSTKRQQDAQEFFLHFVNTLEVGHVLILLFV
jgi:ubiquitin carboxyl-terminal hydrolase 5/13